MFSSKLVRLKCLKGMKKVTIWIKKAFIDKRIRALETKLRKRFGKEFTFLEGMTEHQYQQTFLF